MTLVVGAIEGGDVWLIADAAATGGPIGVRDRRYVIKVEPLPPDGLIAFAGDLHYGKRGLVAARECKAGRATVEMLSAIAREVDNIEFAYAYRDAEGPHLVRIEGATVQDCQTLHLGLADAFEEFQRLRHAAIADHAPGATHLLTIATRTPHPPPEGVFDAITAMLLLIPARAERDVGGWVVPYLLTSTGCYFVTYCYSVTDPVMQTAQVGDAIRHGTAQGGGFALSVCDVDPCLGLVIYWLQRGAGILLMRSAEGYDGYDIGGGPTDFKECAAAVAGRPVDVWFGDKPAADVQPDSIMADQAGRPRIAVSQGKDNIRFAWADITPDSFSVKQTIEMRHRVAADAEPVPLPNNDKK